MDERILHKTCMLYAPVVCTHWSLIHSLPHLLKSLWFPPFCGLSCHDLKAQCVRLSRHALIQATADHLENRMFCKGNHFLFFHRRCWGSFFEIRLSICWRALTQGLTPVHWIRLWTECRSLNAPVATSEVSVLSLLSSFYSVPSVCCLTFYKASPDQIMWIHICFMHFRFPSCLKVFLLHSLSWRHYLVLKHSCISA